MPIFSCSRTKFVEIIINVSFYEKFLLECFDFSSDFYAFDFSSFCLINCSQRKFVAIIVVLWSV